MTHRTVRAHVEAHRPANEPDTLHSVAEKRIILDDQGGVLELDIIEPFACGCSRDRAIGLRCSECLRLHCRNCNNIGVTRSSYAYCGSCSRVVRTRFGYTERVPRRGYWKRRMKRYLKACVDGFLSLLIEREDRP